MSFRRRVASYLQDRFSKAVVTGLRAALRHPEVNRRLDVVVRNHWDSERRRIGNPLLSAGAKSYSQNDEDGILAEILRRMAKERGVFVELGVGDGLENNTLLLLMSGWKGAWIGGEALAFKLPASASKLGFVQAWITRENCAALMKTALEQIGESNPDLISVDLDGNDLYVLQELLLAGAKPDVIVLEYNGKFPPPIRFCVPYRADFSWDGSDFFGASLQSFVDVLQPHGYQLVCCNVTGLNAFFVSAAWHAQFEDVAADPRAHFVAPAYNGFYRAGHPPSAATVETFLRQ